MSDLHREQRAPPKISGWPNSLQVPSDREKQQLPKAWNEVHLLLLQVALDVAHRSLEGEAKALALEMSMIVDAIPSVQRGTTVSRSVALELFNDPNRFTWGENKHQAQCVGPIWHCRAEDMPFACANAIDHVVQIIGRDIWQERTGGLAEFMKLEELATKLHHAVVNAFRFSR